MERHGFYVHKIPEWTITSLSTKEYTLKKQPPRFNAKKYFQGLTKAGRVTAPYPKVAKKRRASIVVCSDVVKKVKLSNESIPVVAKRSLPIPADVNTVANDVGEVASVDDLLAGCDTTIDECVLNEMFIGEDSLDSLISTDSDVADYFSAGETPASDGVGDEDANREQNDVAGVVIKKEVIEDKVQFVRNVSSWEK